MKKITILLISAITFAFITSCGPSKEDAMSYNDKIIREQTKIIQAEKELIGAIKKNLIKGNTLDELLKELSLQIDESAKVIESMEKIGENDDFKNAAMAFVSAYRDVVDNEYTSWLKNIKTPDELVTEDVLYEEEELIHSINRKLDKANNDFINAQKDFSVKYNFKLSEE